MRTLNGDGGVAKVRCPDGTNFTFQASSLSTNGTNHMRGQIPQILYYRWVTKEGGKIKHSVIRMVIVICLYSNSFSNLTKYGIFQL
jgi:hypothetical protein